MEGGSTALFGLDPEASVVVLNDFEGEAESESGSRADVLGGEKRVKNFS